MNMMHHPQFVNPLEYYDYPDAELDNRWIAAEPPLEEIPCKHDGISVRTIFALGKSAFI
jgi:hypothetical protein